MEYSLRPQKLLHTKHDDTSSSIICYGHHSFLSALFYIHPEGLESCWCLDSHSSPRLSSTPSPEPIPKSVNLYLEANSDRKTPHHQKNPRSRQRDGRIATRHQSCRNGSGNQRGLATAHRKIPDLSNTPHTTATLKRVLHKLPTEMPRPGRTRWHQSMFWSIGQPESSRKKYSYLSGYKGSFWKLDQGFYIWRWSQ